MFVDDEGYDDDVLYEQDGTKYKLVGSLTERLRQKDILTKREYVAIARYSGELYIVKR